MKKTLQYRFFLCLGWVLMLPLTLWANTEAYDTDRGFRHPGGLHSEADFMRIRQQLAEGNERVTAAYEVLKNATYAQASAATYPVETIVRGGGNGENYMNAARGATIAYQNALRWKIDGSEAHARHAVAVLNQWARTTKAIGGDSNYALAAGLYGYQFAQAAELMRDYEGWAPEDFAAFKRWMLDVWYPQCIGFLRGRNGTWENSGKWWQAPGHYWSNWGLCNVMALISIGVLCDDVYIYNQGMSYFKYDQVGTYTNPRTDNPIKNDGLTEYLGNLVVTTVDTDMETGAYGQLGQMQESGRDVGHSAMALGLAIDIAKVGWNQGDDLFAYMDHRLAAGIEYVAAQTQSVKNLPWTDYHYGSSGYYYSDSRAWLMTEPALGAQMRPYWGTVIGIYEGVKGVEMPYSKIAYNEMGIDAGGQGSTSGGYDHLGYSVLMNTYDGLAAADEVPTELTPKMEYSGSFTGLVPSMAVEKALGNVDGNIICHNELGGLINAYTINNKTTLPKGQTVCLMPQLPEGEEDSGQWLWNTGETTRNITVTTDRSYVYRVTYTNSKGVESHLCFALAVAGDCEKTTLTPSVKVDGVTTTGTTEATVFYNGSVTLSVSDAGGWGTYKWSNGKSGSAITMTNIKEDTSVTVTFTNQGGCESSVNFTIKVRHLRPDVIVNGNTLTDTHTLVVEEGDNIVLAPYVPVLLRGEWLWSDGSTEKTLAIDSISSSGEYIGTYTMKDSTLTCVYRIYVDEGSKTYRTYTSGNYLVRHRYTDTYLTSPGEKDAYAYLAPLVANADTTEVGGGQLWFLEEKNARYNLMSIPDSLYLNKEGLMKTLAVRPFRIKGAKNTDWLSIQNNGTSGNICWTVSDEGIINYAGAESPTDYPFELIPYRNAGQGVCTPHDAPVMAIRYYTLSGQPISEPQGGILIRRTIYSDGKVHIEKVWR